jgi:hypothetical protein
MPASAIPMRGNEKKAGNANHLIQMRDVKFYDRGSVISTESSCLLIERKHAMNDIFQYDTQTAEGFEAIYDLGHDVATQAYRASILAGEPRIYEDQAILDTIALRAASQYREAQQASVPNFTDDDERFDIFFASGYIVATLAERDTYVSDPEGYRAELAQATAFQLPAATIVDAEGHLAQDPEE